MSHPTPDNQRAQFTRLFQALVIDPDLLLSRVFSSQIVIQTIARHVEQSCDRIYTPLVTLATFLAQIFSDDHSCRAAVARLKAWRVGQALPSCSLATGGYCKARKRLPEALMAELVRTTADGLQEDAPQAWLFHGRPVVIVDGSTVSMPDTAENQREFPQHVNQKPGCGFPIARIVVLLSLATGAVLDSAVTRWMGKLTGESALLRGLRGRLKRGDILLADSLYCSYQEIVALLEKGVDVVMRQHGSRQSDFRRGKRLGREDHLVEWQRGRARRSWMDRLVFAQLPRSIVMRELRVHVDKPGFRTRSFVIVTSLLDPEVFSPQDLAGLYRDRWHAELDLRSIKQIMKMDVLRCKTPEMVRKEIWGHLLVYNLLRAVMAEAANRHGVSPRQLSFQGTRQVIEGFRVELARASLERAITLREDAWSAIASERVGDRPDRYEPRKRKRREKMYPRLQEPRYSARKRMARAS